MKDVTLKIPPDVPALLKMSDEDFAREAQVLLAVKLFELGKLNSGKAAELAGMPRAAFLYTLLAITYPPSIYRRKRSSAKSKPRSGSRLDPAHPRR
jgi:hypothetical protein